MPSKLLDNTEKSLEQQLSDLKTELATITNRLSSNGYALYDEARLNTAETYDKLQKHGRVAAKQIKHQAHIATDTAREHPLAAAAVVAGIGLMLALIMRR